MTEEDYVSFETAKLLKEKGFDEITFTWYTGKGKFCVGKNNFDDYHMNHFSNMAVARDKNKCSAPTLQLAMKWLRKAHNQNIIFDMLPKGNNCYVLWTFNIISNKNYKIVWGPKQPKYKTYEEAAEEAIKYCIKNLI